MNDAVRIGIVAGEASGDQLGAALIEALRARSAHVECYGVAGPKMRAAGCEVWAPSDRLAMMGLAEVLTHLPALLRFRRELLGRFSARPPHVFVGIDAPEFNLGLELRLKRRGIRTVQYVSPQVWAWRQGRVRTMAAACDRVLCLLPFETRFYAAHAVSAAFVGHPLADRVPLAPDRAAARASLGIAPQATVIALLPGSRLGEIEKLGADFAQAAARIARRRPDAVFVAPMASSRGRETFERVSAGSGAAIRLIDGCSHEVLAACDVALVASGTATLETLLFKRPMVVAYRMSALTAFLLRRLGLVKVPYFAQPNLLLERRAVPEFFQEAVKPQTLSDAVLHWLEHPAQVASLQSEFLHVHQMLQQGGADRAAGIILGLANAGA